MKRKDKETLLSWLHSTITNTEKEVFLKMGYKTAEQILKAIKDGAPKK